MRLVLLGLPGAGKGTQGELIARKYGIPHISTGAIIREAVATGIGYGKEADAYLTKGNLIPDDVAIEIVYDRLNKPDCRRGWILDGFPRTVHQAQALDKKLAQDGSDVQMAFEIRITKKSAIERIAKRRMCRDCGAIYHLEFHRAKGKGVCDLCGGELFRRDDDTEETARRRFYVYMQQTHPVMHYYAQDGRLYSVDGIRSIGDVFVDVDHHLQRLVAEQNVGEAQ